MELTVGQAAKILKVTPYRVRELIVAGRLKARHHPSAYYWLITRKSLDAYMLKGRLRAGRPRAIDTKRHREEAQA
jgi:hypothetical protein